MPKCPPGSGASGGWLPPVPTVCRPFPSPLPMQQTLKPPHPRTWEIGDPLPVQLVRDADFHLVQGIQDVQFRQGQPVPRPADGEALEKLPVCWASTLASPLLFTVAGKCRRDGPRNMQRAWECGCCLAQVSLSWVPPCDPVLTAPALLTLQQGHVEGLSPPSWPVAPGTPRDCVDPQFFLAQALFLPQSLSFPPRVWGGSLCASCARGGHATLSSALLRPPHLSAQSAALRHLVPVWGRCVPPTAQPHTQQT